jgi:hypothetical protein
MIAAALAGLVLGVCVWLAIVAERHLDARDRLPDEWIRAQARRATRE